MATTFKAGERVECWMRDEGLASSWYAAKVLRPKGTGAAAGSALLGFEQLLEDDDDGRHLEEWVPRALLRPVPPPAPDGFLEGSRTLAAAAPGEHLELAHEGGWWQVSLRRRGGGGKYTVLYAPAQLEHTVDASMLRPRWTWAPSGAWTYGKERRRLPAAPGAVDATPAAGSKRKRPDDADADAAAMPPPPPSAAPASSSSHLAPPSAAGAGAAAANGGATPASAAAGATSRGRRGWETLSLDEKVRAVLAAGGATALWQPGGADEAEARLQRALRLDDQRDGLGSEEADAKLWYGASEQGWHVYPVAMEKTRQMKTPKAAAEGKTPKPEGKGTAPASAAGASKGAPASAGGALPSEKSQRYMYVSPEGDQFQKIHEVYVYVRDRAAAAAAISAECGETGPVDPAAFAGEDGWKPGAPGKTPRWVFEAMARHAAALWGEPTPPPDAAPAAAPAAAAAAAAAAADDGADDEPEYNVERVVGKRTRKVKGKEVTEYEVKWEGYASSENTWEPVAHLEGCMSFVKAFEKGAASGSKKK